MNVAMKNQIVDPVTEVVEKIKTQAAKPVLEFVSLKMWTTFKCASEARAIVSPQSMPELCKLIQILSKSSTPWRVIGRGSNLLVKDGGYPGILIDLSEGFSKIEIQKEKWREVLVRVEAGVANGTLLQWTREKALSGFGFSFGIPGSIGGGIRMNAGTPLGWFGDVLTQVEGVDFQGKEKVMKVTSGDFVYRDFPKGHDCILTAGTFKFKRSNVEKVEREIQAAKEKRANQPLELPNIGSVFKNPKGDFAGRLIEESGLKGYQVGDAQISPKHANFIVNLKNAKTSDALKVMQHAKQVVQVRFGVELEPEVHVIGVDR